MGLLERREYSFSRKFELVAAIIMITLTPKTEAGVSGQLKCKLHPFVLRYRTENILH